MQGKHASVTTEWYDIFSSQSSSKDFFFLPNIANDEEPVRGGGGGSFSGSHQQSQVKWLKQELCLGLSVPFPK